MKPGMMAHACNASTQDSKLEASLVSKTLTIKNKKEEISEILTKYSISSVRKSISGWLWVINLQSMYCARPGC
jgi:hypothetical protein